MPQPDLPDFETLSLHGGHRPDSDFGARAVPIYQTTSYVFQDVDHAAGLFNLERQGHIYSRISNPTVAVFEERVAALEGGVGSVATASGQAALWLAISTLASAGDHIVCSRNVYGGTNNLLTQTLPRFGISTTLVDPRAPDGFAAAIRPETKLIIGESLGNPGLEIMDLDRVAAIAHEAGIAVLIDNTFATPYLFRPFDHGADLVYHSATKFLGGHGIAVGGVLVVDDEQVVVGVEWQLVRIKRPLGLSRRAGQLLGKRARGCQGHRTECRTAKKTTPRGIGSVPHVKTLREKSGWKSR